MGVNKVMAFRAQFRGVKDIPFFIFRLAKIFAQCRAPELANTPGCSSKQAVRATPKGLAPHALCRSVHENAAFRGYTVTKSTPVHEIVRSGGQDIKQPKFYVEPCVILRQTDMSATRRTAIPISTTPSFRVKTMPEGLSRASSAVTSTTPISAQFPLWSKRRKSQQMSSRK